MFFFCFRFTAVFCDIFMGNLLGGSAAAVRTMGDSAVKARMDQLIQQKQVFVVEKVGCPFCSTAKRVLSEYDIPDESILFLDISRDPNMSEIQDYMSVITGGRTVRFLFTFSHPCGQITLISIVVTIDSLISNHGPPL